MCLLACLQGGSRQGKCPHSLPLLSSPGPALSFMSMEGWEVRRRGSPAQRAQGPKMTPSVKTRSGLLLRNVNQNTKRDQPEITRGCERKNSGHCRRSHRRADPRDEAGPPEAQLREASSLREGAAAQAGSHRCPRTARLEGRPSGLLFPAI